MFGVSDPIAEVEIIALASHIMKSFGATVSDFEIRLNDRSVLASILNEAGVAEKLHKHIFRILDKKEKLSEEEFRKELAKYVGDDLTKKIMELFYFGEAVFSSIPESEAGKRLNFVIDGLRELGVGNVRFEPSLTRGFDYYTGIVFEVFDVNKENSRSLFGGGRYDRLTESFIKDAIPAVGFGMGDVTIKDFITTHGRMPELPSRTKLYLSIAPNTDVIKVYRLADTLRERGISLFVDISGKKLSDQLKNVEKRCIPYLTVVGDSELSSNQLTVRNIKTREEKQVSLDELSQILS